ncbi:TORTIFOLIA1-like protein 4 [Mercurialis annua]|uniref:TORTIFOLIA1-like protein 4 n=1 Tax=Mercurialis annua TaxID=3986 RepID=UPI00215F349D|nr:TORTIFOLIA1-like protein 4 [Mercurialis annua]
MSPQRRSSLSPPSSTTPTTTPTNDLRTRVITCLNKLSDRDTLSLAATELESIAKSLTTHDAFSSFLTCIHNTDSATKSPVRKHCVNLLTLLSNSHGNSLSPHFSKMISTLTRRLRDPDSAVRSACIEATTAMSIQITNSPFSALFKPLIDIMSVEKDYSSQVGSALCLAAAIEAAPEPEVEMLRKVLPRLGKLVRSDGFKAKGPLLSVVGSIVSVGGAKSKGVLDWLVPCLVEFLSCDDWAARKSAAEVLGKVAVVEKELAAEHKGVCLSCLENKRFDKVKAVRETMNRTLELWKEVSDGVPVKSQSKSSSIDKASSGSFHCASDSSHGVGLISPLPKKTVSANRSPSSDASAVTTARKQSPLKSINDNTLSSKVDHKKTSAWKIEIAQSQDTGGLEDDIKRRDSGGFEARENENNGRCRPETKRVLFSSARDDKLHKFSGSRSGSRVVPCNDDDNCYAKDIEVNYPNEDFLGNNKEIEDLSLIRDQLIQIENQQSNLLDLLQRFMGSSQHGINSLETRVRGLEMVLDEISHDFGLSTGRLPHTESADNTCCKLPGTEFLSSKFWRRTEGRYSSPGNMQSLNTARSIHVAGASNETFDAAIERSQYQSRGGFSIADGRYVAKRNSGFYPGQMPSNIVQDDGQVLSGRGIAEASSTSYTTPSRRLFA